MANAISNKGGYRDEIRAINVLLSPELHNEIFTLAKHMEIPAIEVCRRALENFIKAPTFEDSKFRENLRVQRSITAGRGPQIPPEVRIHAALAIVDDAMIFGQNLSQHKLGVLMAGRRGKKVGPREKSAVKLLLEEGMLEYGPLLDTSNPYNGVMKIGDHVGDTCIHITEKGRTELARLEKELLK